MTAPPIWTHEPGDNAYTLMVGSIEGRVRLNWTRRWRAIVRRRGLVEAIVEFDTPEEGMRWCEERAIEIEARDR